MKLYSHKNYIVSTKCINYGDEISQIYGSVMEISTIGETNDNSILVFGNLLYFS